MLAAGAKVGPYEVTALLGRGGMGAVYRARDGRGAEAAVKVLIPDLAKDPRYVERFKREAQAAEAVTHRNVVRCLGSGEDRGTLWIADSSGDKLIAFGTEMYSRGLDKGDELEADKLGVVIAARGGYDAYGLPSVLQTLQAMNAQDSALALMFKTHPAPAERLDALAEKMQPVLDAYAGQAQLADRFVRQVRK